MFSMLYEANFTYDSSMPIYDNKPPSFPYTLDYKGKEGLQPNPTKSINHTGMWGLINRSHGHVGHINQSQRHVCLFKQSNGYVGRINQSHGHVGYCIF